MDGGRIPSAHSYCTSAHTRMPLLGGLELSVTLGILSYCIIGKQCILKVLTWIHRLLYLISESIIGLLVFLALLNDLLENVNSWQAANTLGSHSVLLRTNYNTSHKIVEPYDLEFQEAHHIRRTICA